MGELLPCPFCGATDGDLVQLFTRIDDFAYWSVECLECGCEIGDDAGQAEADKHWNTRAAADHITRLESDVATLLPVVRAIDEASQNGRDTIELLIELNCIGKQAREALSRISTRSAADA